MSSVRRAAVLAVALVSLAAPGAALAAPAAAIAPPAAALTPPISAHQQARTASAAATGYTYWGYYQWTPNTSAWEFAPVGANDTKQLPEDGDVYGFRWALQVQDPRPPRAEANFEALCAETPTAAGGEKRIAFVLDYGSDLDAPEGSTPPEPRGTCALVDESFTVQQALQVVAEVRVGDDGLICGIDGYPAQGCGEVFKNAEEGPADVPVELVLPSDESEDSATSDTPDDASADSDSDGGGVPWGLVVAGGVVVVLAGGALALRKRRA